MKRFYIVAVAVVVVISLLSVQPVEASWTTDILKSIKKYVMAINTRTKAILTIAKDLQNYKDEITARIDTIEAKIDIIDFNAWSACDDLETILEKEETFCNVNGGSSYDGSEAQSQAGDKSQKEYKKPKPIK